MRPSASTASMASGEDSKSASNISWLCRRASSACFLSVMSREMPKRPMTLAFPIGQWLQGQTDREFRAVFAAKLNLACPAGRLVRLGKLLEKLRGIALGHDGAEVRPDQLFLGITKSLRNRWIHEEKLALQVGHAHQVGGFFDHLRQPADFVLGALAFADVQANGDEVSDLALGVVDRGDGPLFIVEAAVLAAIDEFPAPFLAGKKRAPEFLVKGGRLAAGPEGRRALPDDFLGSVTGQRLDGGIGPDDGSIAVDDGIRPCEPPPARRPAD